MLESLAAYKGQFAALTTALCWTATALFFTAAGRRLGTTVVNSGRIVMAVVLLGLVHHYLTGTWIPEAQSRQVWYLAVSGVVGLSIGDQALFLAFVTIGPRLSTLIMTTSPIFAAVFGFIVLDERLGPLGLLGMALTIGGVAWVVLERKPHPEFERPHTKFHGIVLAVVGAACQAGGLLLSKQGMGHGWLPESDHIAPQAATLIRMVFAAIGMIPILAVHAARERARRAVGALPKRQGRASVGWLCAFGGAVAGPFLGVWMSLIAAKHTPIGIAQTLCSMVPIFIVPAVVLVYKERVSARAFVGAVIAVAGAAVLFYS